MYCQRCGKRLMFIVNDADGLQAKVTVWCPICLLGYQGTIHTISTREVMLHEESRREQKL